MVALAARGMPYPRLGLFARRDILPGEELCYAYGSPNKDGGAWQRQCLCGTDACLGYLPCDP